MISGIVGIASGIAVMIASGVGVSAALNWLNTFEFGSSSGKKSSKRNNHMDHMNNAKSRANSKSNADFFGM